MIRGEIPILVARAQTGDRLAYGELVERFQPTVYALALGRLRNPTDAQELTQEVFVHGMTKLGQLREADRFAGWLRQITVRMALNRLTRRRPLPSGSDDIIENSRATGPTPLEEIVRSEQRDALWHGLNRLNTTDRATLVAFYIRGRSLKQMSQEFEAPVGTIKRRLHTARTRLRRHLEKGSPTRQTPAPAAREWELSVA